MTKQKKSYVKPEFTIIPACSPRYKEILAALEAEGQLPQQHTYEMATDSRKEETRV